MLEGSVAVQEKPLISGMADVRFLIARRWSKPCVPTRQAKRRFPNFGVGDEVYGEEYPAVTLPH
jgi:hypothetical protein